MSDTQNDVKSQLKLAQLWHLVRLAKDNESHKAVVDNLLDDDFDLNRRVTIKPELRLLSDDYLKDCTALHFIHHNVDIFNDIDTFNSLLERGADYTLKNGEGQTVLHSIVSSFGKNLHCSKREIPFANSILAAHVKHRNSSNPQDNNGVTHLHGACLFNHVEALKLFLENGVSIDQTVKFDSKIYPGYTPLHVAVLYGSFEVAQVLVSHGADVNAKNAKGMSPLDLCMKRRVEILTYSSQRQVHEGHAICADELCKNEKIIKLLLESQCVSAIGLSSFHAAVTLKDLSIAESLLNQVEDIDHAVPKESHIYSRYTAAYFATFNSVDAIKMLVMRGAKLDFENRNVTPLDLCFERYSSQDVHSILSCTDNWKEIYLSASRIRLLDFLQSAACPDRLKLLLQKSTEDSNVSSDYPSWRGHTMLHLAVIISKATEGTDDNMQSLYAKDIIEECLRVGQSVNVQNLRGESVVHLAFKLAKRNIVKLLLEHLDKQEEVSNLVDNDNLSYLHIACAEKNESLVEKLLLSTSEAKVVNCKGKRFSYHHNSWKIVAGSTPLHIAASRGSSAIAEMLMRHGADLHATDSNGMSAIHCLIIRYSPGLDDLRVADVLFRSLLEDPKDRVVEGIGLSYLHVACFFGNLQAVQKLLELGSNINAAISLLDSSDKRLLPSSSNRKSSLELYAQFTPLHMVQANPIDEVIDLLMLRGVDLFAKSTASFSRMSKNYFPLRNKNIMRRFMLMLWQREDMQKSMEEKLGMTKLHVACYLKNEESVRSVLNEGCVDVNAQIRADSGIFAKCTPLHLLLTISEDFAYGMGRFQLDNMGGHQAERFTVGPIVDLLLDRGAEVTILNAQENTPVHLLRKYHFYFTDANRCDDLLLNAHRDFSVNPANKDGMSHFHLACCLHKAEIVEKFLQHGSVDVNQPINFFAKRYAGYTPLHWALLMRHNNINWPSVSQIVDLLLKYGADVSAKDAHGDTPLHQPAVLHSPELNLLNKLLSYGADINSENVKGQTPFDKHSFDENSIDFVSLYKKYNHQIKGWNRLTGEGYVGRMLSSYGRNITERPEFKELLQSPAVRTVDEKGRTVIHNAVAVLKPFIVIEDNYASAIEKFIALGIDLEHRDESGQTALHYAARMENPVGTTVLLRCGADINIVDNNGKSAFSYAANRDIGDDYVASFTAHDSATESLYLHTQKLLHLGIDVSEDNRNLVSTIQQHLSRMKFLTSGIFGRKYNLQQAFFNQVDMTKTMNVGVASLVVFDFLKESGAITLYPFLSIPERTVVDDFFKNFNEREFNELIGIVKLQFRKMTARLELIDPALNTLRALLGFSFAGLCEEITRFLTNNDLKNLIAATKLEDDENGKINHQVAVKK